MTRLAAILKKLDEIEAEADAATHGPWAVLRDTGCDSGLPLAVGAYKNPVTGALVPGVVEFTDDNKQVAMVCRPDRYEKHVNIGNDFPFIASSRANVPVLVKALRVAIQGFGPDFEVEIAKALGVEKKP